LADTNFIDNVTIISPEWLNDINTLKYTDYPAHITAFDSHIIDYDAHVITYDTHIANVANPHSVTKVHVGLGNVTDDAQLKISSNLSDLNNASTSRTNLGLGTVATQDANSIAITGGTIDSVTITGGTITGITDITISDGGTGQSTAQSAIDALSQVSGATDEYVLTKDTATGNAVFKVAVVEVADGSITNAKLATDAIQGDGLYTGTTIATTSGTSHDFTGIPSWVKKITVMINGVSTNGTSPVIVRIGDSGGIEATGYSSSGMRSFVTDNNGTLTTTEFLIDAASQDAVTTRHGTMTLTRQDSLTWVSASNTSRSDALASNNTAGSKTLSDTLDRIRLTTVNGTDTFDAGSINILYE